MNSNSSTNPAFSDIRSVSGDVTQEKEAEKYVEPWCSASKNWFMEKILFRREVIAGSTHPNVITKWLAEVDIAANIEDLNHSGFVFDKLRQCFGLLIQRSPEGLRTLSQQNSREGSVSWKRNNTEELPFAERHANYVRDFLFLQN